jgi:hypothetical protein
MRSRTFTFLTLDTNRRFGDRGPQDYLYAAESDHPGVLASHWIPADPELWKVDRYPDFLAARRQLLADAANRFLEELLLGRTVLNEEPGVLEEGSMLVVDTDEESPARAEAIEWARAHGLRIPVEDLALLSLDGAREDAVLDLAWPSGLLHGEQRVALLLDEPPAVHDAAGRHGYRFFTDLTALRRYAEQELLQTAP